MSALSSMSSLDCPNVSSQHRIPRPNNNVSNNFPTRNGSFDIPPERSSIPTGGYDFIPGRLNNSSSDLETDVEDPSHYVNQDFLGSADQNTQSVPQEPYNITNVELNTTGVSFNHPKCKNYAIPHSRKSTFKSFGDKHLDIPVDDLVEAGFYYSGSEDTVVCFYCGQGLGGWEFGDRPWTEHARWSPNCTHLLNMKGITFVKEVLENSNDPEKLREIDVRYSLNKRGSTCHADSTKYPLTEVPTVSYTQEDIKQYPAVASVLTIEHDIEKVMKAVKILLKRKNLNRLDFKAQELMEIVLDIDDGIIDQKEIQELTKDQDLEEDGSVRNLNVQESTVKENEMLKRRLQCKVCQRNIIGIVFIPCGHMCVCTVCAPEVIYCPISGCKEYIRGTVKTYLS